MRSEFIQIPANTQEVAKSVPNALLRGGHIASVRKEFVANTEAGVASKVLNVPIFR